MNIRSTPAAIKVYEALWAISDKRVIVSAPDSNGLIASTVDSSSGNKTYTVQYSPDDHRIMANDNGSYRVWYLWYPSIAVLMKTGVLPYHADYAHALKWVHRKQINTDFKNDFEKTTQRARASVAAKGINLNEFDHYIDHVLNTLDFLAGRLAVSTRDLVGHFASRVESAKVSCLSFARKFMSAGTFSECPSGFIDLAQL